MSELQTFQVFPFIPEPLAFLEELSRNLWWSWQHDAIELFRRIDPGLWESKVSTTSCASAMFTARARTQMTTRARKALTRYLLRFFTKNEASRKRALPSISHLCIVAGVERTENKN